MEVLNTLRSITEEDGKTAYIVKYKVLNSKDHAGIPQSRPRVFIVGIRTKYQVTPFRWPRAVPINPGLMDRIIGKKIIKDVVDAESLQPGQLAKVIQGIEPGDPWSEHWFIDCDSSPRFSSSAKQDICPCLTRTRAGNKGFFVTSLGTKLFTAQMLRLQGVSPARLRKPKSVTAKQFDMAIGNAVTVPLLTKLLERMAVAVGLIPAQAAR